MCRNKIKKIFIKPIFIFLSIISFLSLASVVYMNYALPEYYNVFENETLSLKTKIPISVKYSGIESSGKNFNSDKQLYSVKLNIMGIIPVKTASVNIITQKEVMVLGNPFGIKIYTDGVMVVEVDSVDTENGNKTPAADAGIKKGDLIVSINGKNVYSNEDVASIIETSNGKTVNIKIKRGEKSFFTNLKPLLSYSSGKYKSGIWVRDSSAGIGTLTFFNPSLNIICGLGHGVCDTDTGRLLTINSGELVEAEIISVNKGSSGSPGELKGKFSEKTIGNLKINNETGIYAETVINYDKNLTEIALKQEIKCGKAKLLVTIDNQGPKLYDCEIKNISHSGTLTKNMVVKITDEELLKKTGGIVQGMSGSPILQNGKLIGAVTHVLVDDPTKGYAIFAENMLETAKNITKEQAKKVS